MSDLSADREAILCPYCGDTVPELIEIETGMKLRLKDSGQVNPVPEQVCSGCHEQMTKIVSSSATLKAEQKAKEANRLVLWQNRVSLVKQAKAHFNEKKYAEAAVGFEKYIRCLEIVYEVEPGGLDPEMFRKGARDQEITVVTSVFWDLMKIYDVSTTYAERHMKAAEKLAQFVRFAPIFAQIMRKAEQQVKVAKNPAAFEKFLTEAQSVRPRCFIATAAFDGLEKSEVVRTLCEYRDQRLMHHPIGRAFVALYYRLSPPVASALDAQPRCKPLVRFALKKIAESRFVRNSLNR